jgi:anti-sigma factor ChrR (cupin superfamily)
MSCDELTLQAYIDGEADAVNALRIEEHVRDCAVCAERVRFAKSLGPPLREHARSMQAPAALRARILAMADEAAPAEPATAPASRPWHRDVFRLPSLQRASW